MPLPTGDLGQRGGQEAQQRRSQDFNDLEQAAVERLSGLDSVRRRRTAFLPAAGEAGIVNALCGSLIIA